MRSTYRYPFSAAMISALQSGNFSTRRVNLGRRLVVAQKQFAGIGHSFDASWATISFFSTTNAILYPTSP
jgi:hypothetical protein